MSPDERQPISVIHAAGSEFAIGDDRGGPDMEPVENAPGFYRHALPFERRRSVGVPPSPLHVPGGLPADIDRPTCVRRAEEVGDPVLARAAHKITEVVEGGLFAMPHGQVSMSCNAVDLLRRLIIDGVTAAQRDLLAAVEPGHTDVPLLAAEKRARAEKIIGDALHDLGIWNVGAAEAIAKRLELGS